MKVTDNYSFTEHEESMKYHGIEKLLHRVLYWLEELAEVIFGMESWAENISQLFVSILVLLINLIIQVPYFYRIFGNSFVGNIFAVGFVVLLSVAYYGIWIIIAQKHRCFLSMLLPVIMADITSCILVAQAGEHMLSMDSVMRVVGIFALIAAVGGLLENRIYHLYILRKNKVDFHEDQEMIKSHYLHLLENEHENIDYSMFAKLNDKYMLGFSKEQLQGVEGMQEDMD